MGKWLYRGFLFILFASAFWYSGRAILSMVDYLLLNSKAVVASISWSTKKIDSDKFILEGNYTFIANGSTFNGSSLLQKPIFLNVGAAEYTLHKDPPKIEEIWYRGSNPNHSALQKSFPIKECVSSILLWGIFFYFQLRVYGSSCFAK